MNLIPSCDSKMPIAALLLRIVCDFVSVSGRCLFQNACGVSFALILLANGCASAPAVAKVTRDRMLAHPDDYRRVEVLPIWFKGSAITDGSLSTNDLKVLNYQAGTNLLNALARVFSEKGYDVVEPGSVLCDPAELDAFDSETRELLARVQTNFITLGREICQQRSNRKQKPGEYMAENSVTELRKKLGLGAADLLVLMESNACFESPDARHKRHKWNWTGGAILTPLYICVALSGAGRNAPDFPLLESPEWIEHAVLILDARTLAVLFCNGRSFRGEDARNPEVLRGKLKDTLADLPELPKRK